MVHSESDRLSTGTPARTPVSGRRCLPVSLPLSPVVLSKSGCPSTGTPVSSAVSGRIATPHRLYTYSCH